MLFLLSSLCSNQCYMDMDCSLGPLPLRGVPQSATLSPLFFNIYIGQGYQLVWDLVLLVCWWYPIIYLILEWLKVQVPGGFASLDGEKLFLTQSYWDWIAWVFGRPWSGDISDEYFNLTQGSVNWFLKLHLSNLPYEITNLSCTNPDNGYTVIKKDKVFPTI